MTKRLTKVERKMFVQPLIYSISWISVNEYFITIAGWVLIYSRSLEHKYNRITQLVIYFDYYI